MRSDKSNPTARILPQATAVTAILLSGGQGTRMGSALPKQYLPLQGRPIVSYSLACLLNHPAITQYIVVCDPSFHAYFSDPRLERACPGKRRQDSLFNGLQLVRNEWVCIHDAARPFITLDMVSRLIDAGQRVGAATLALPVTSTIKAGTPDHYVHHTLNRDQLWTIQTPQLLAKPILEAGFAYADQHQITVTDDVSLAELIGHPVQLVQGDEKNIKITTPEELRLCQNISLP